jgi:hypothetical protein
MAVLAPLLTAVGCADLPTEPIAALPAGATAYEGAAQTPSCCVLDPVIVVAPGPAECDPYQSLDWCEGEGGGECMTSQPETGGSEYQTTAGCNDTGGGSPGDGSGSPPPGGPTPTEPPPPTEQPDTCRTGDDIVDDPEVSKGLSTLWAESNPDADLYHRVEKAGWIVEYPAGQFSVMVWTGGTERFGCGDYPMQPAPSRGTIVGFVHTHPYEVGEAIIDCNFTSVSTYDGTPSEVDRRTSAALGNLLGRTAPLPGYIIDKDGYYRYDGAANTATPRLPRCGY